MSRQPLTWTNVAGSTSGGISATSEFNAERGTRIEQQITEGWSTFLDVDGQFGGGWNGVELACAEAINSGGPSPLVFMGAHEYVADSQIELTRPFTIWGTGIRTRIRHASGFTDYVFSGKEMKRDGEWEGSSGSMPNPVYDEADDDGGMEIANLAIVENNRNTANVRGIEFWDVDDLYMHNMQFGFLTGTALKLGADDSEVGDVSGMAAGRVRESDFDRIRIYRCGSGSPAGGGFPDIPGFILQNGDHATSDGTNQNYFSKFRYVYNEGRMLIRGGAHSSNSLRRTIFRDFQMHALADNNAWVPEQWFPFNFCELQGAVRETLFDGVMTNGNAAGTAMWIMTPHPTDTAVGAQPKRLILKNVNAVNVHGSLVKVNQGDTVSIEGSGLGSVSEYVLDVAASATTFSRASIYEHGINSVGSSLVRNLSGGGTISRYYHGGVTA
jgi:hypothetical protein